MAKKKHHDHSPYIIGMFCAGEAINYVYAKNEVSAFILYMFPKTKFKYDFGKLIIIYVPQKLREFCIKELTLYDTIQVKIIRLDNEYINSRYEYKLLEIEIIKHNEGIESKEQFHIRDRFKFELDRIKNKHVCKFVKAKIQIPQRLKTVYAKSIIFFADPCLLIDNTAYYINPDTNRLCSVKNDYLVRQEAQYYVHELDNVDKRLLDLYYDHKRKKRRKHSTETNE